MKLEMSQRFRQLLLRQKLHGLPVVGASANVSDVSNSSETSTSAGKRNAVICATEFLTTETARSAWPLAASVPNVLATQVVPLR